MNIYEILKEQQNLDKIAIIDGEIMVTYKELYENARIIKEQMNLNVYGNSIGILLDNNKEYIYSYFAVAESENIIVPIFPQLSLSDINVLLDLCNITTIITNKKYSAKIESINYKGKIFIIEDGSYSNIGIKLTSTSEYKDVAILLPTSGTLSKQKRVMLTHEGLIANSYAHIKSVKMNKDEKTLIVLSMCFGYCNVTQILSTIIMGGTIVIYKGSIIADDVSSAIEYYKITNLTCVPFVLEMLYKKMINKDRLKSLNFICFGGSKMNKSILEKLVAYYENIAFYQTYGQTEAGPRITTKMLKVGNIDICNLGYPLEGVEIRIVNKKGECVEALQKGEIIIKSKAVMKGYYGNIIHTNKALINGWLFTGDIGSFTREGELLLFGRMCNVVKIMGISIDLEEVEAVIRCYKHVLDVSVHTEKRDIIGEILVAKIVIDISESETLKDDILDYCKKNMSSYKIPAKLVFCDKIEKTYTGKVKRS